MATFGLDALSARKGDALVLRWGNAKPSLALIDGGPSTVYAKAIQPHLQALAGTDPAGKPRPVALRLVVVSHIDDDHIRGILDLATAIDTAEKQARQVPATIEDVWYNSYADLEFLDDFADQPELQKALRNASADPEVLEPAGPPVLALNQPAGGAQGVNQARELDRTMRRLAKVPKNRAFAVMGSFVRSGPDVDIDGLKVTVLAPNDGLLQLLKTHWRAELKKALVKEIAGRPAGIAALAAAFDDASVPNQSSIVLLVEFGGKTMLLTGDARGDHIIEAIKAHGGLALPLEVDLFKVPHHGSAHSNDAKLFEAVRATHYVISGNGEHGNPHPVALEALFDTQKGRAITVHLTNRPEAGAVKPEDVANAKKAQLVLDGADAGPDVTVLYRDDKKLAISVDLL